MQEFIRQEFIRDENFSFANPSISDLAFNHEPLVDSMVGSDFENVDADMIEAARGFRTLMSGACGMSCSVSDILNDFMNRI